MCVCVWVGGCEVAKRIYFFQTRKPERGDGERGHTTDKLIDNKNATKTEKLIKKLN